MRIRTAIALVSTTGLLAAGATVGAAHGAAASSPTGASTVSAPAAAACGPGRGVPVDDVSIQLYTFSEYVGGGTDAPTLARLRGVLAELADIGYRKVEPYTLYGLTPQRFARLLQGYGLTATSRHGSTDPATWDVELATAKRLGQEFTGSGGSASPGTGSYTDTLATASNLNRLGRLSRANGTGKVAVHNHQYEFTSTFTDPFTGRETSAWELLVEHTDPRYVTFQLDTGWAVAAGRDVPRLLRDHGDRIDLLHVKDGIRAEGDLDQRPLGEGELDVEGMLAAAKAAKVDTYVFEQDPVYGGEVDTMLDEARTSFEYLDCVRF